MKNMVTLIKIEGEILRGVFQDRLNRFLALVKVKDEVQSCFLPNPGRLSELLISGSEVLLREVFKEKRKTSYDIIAVLHNELIVSIDSRIPNKLVFEALKNGDLSELSGYDLIKPEFKYEGSRFDFLLTSREKVCLLEVKSCTLVINGLALFPDGATKRGKRQIDDLLRAKRKGHRACVFFLVQRGDSKVFTLNDENDPWFARAIRKAVKEGVEVYAYSSEFIEDRIYLMKSLMVDLNQHLLS
jgi:sugar fermentation stimulation protein A